MAEIHSDYQEIYKRLGEIQPKIDELFLQAIESSEFQSATIVVRLNVGAEGKVDNAEVLSEEYKKSKFGKMVCELAAKSLVPGEKFKNGTIRVRLVWSDAFHLLGESVMAPLNAEHVGKIYTGGVILKKYTGSIQEMFRKLDTLIGVPVYGDTVIEIKIGKGGKVESSNLVNQVLRGTLLDQHAAELVKNWQFPGVKDELKVKVALRRGVSQAQVRAAAAGRTFGGGVATELPAYPVRQFAYPYAYSQYRQPIYGGPATELVAYPTRQGWQYGYLPFQGGPATEVIAYPTRPGLQYGYPYLQYGYPPFYGGPATELIAYPTRQGLG